ncbi:MAG TPA: hypothetical protein VJ998_03250 [Pseudomonadales bacterium]|nr:hypothetical protein [Pseudomonadales bacterium]
MSLKPPFWIPSLADLDDAVYGGFDELSIPGALNAAPVLSDIGIDARFIREFLYEVSHSFEALFLAGYKVPWIEFGLQPVSSVNIFTEENSNGIWIRADLQNRKIEINNRPATDHTNRVRMKVEPIASPDKVFALEMGQARMEEVINKVKIGFDHSRDVETMEMVEFINTSVGTPELQLVVSNDNSRGVMIYREDIAVALQDLSGISGTLDLDLGFDHPMVPKDQAKALCHLIFDAFQYAIFDSITWVMGHITIAAVDDFLTDAGSTPVLRDLPGMVWIIDPAAWENGAQQRPGPRDVETMLGELKVAPALLAEYASSEIVVSFSDPPADLDEAYPAIVRNSKQVGFLYGIARGVSLNLELDPATRVEGMNMRPLDRLLDLILGHGARGSSYELLRANKRTAKETLLAWHPLFKSNESLEGLLNDLLRVLPPEDVSLISKDVDYLVKNFRSAYHGLAMAFEPSGELKLLKLRAKRAVNHSYPALILSLFNFGVFSIEQIVGDLNADPEVGAVEVLDESPSKEAQRWRFKHTLYDHPGFVVYLGDHIAEDGLVIDDLVAWEYVPAQPEPPRKMREALVAAGLFPADNTDRLILVAGPGIGISGLSDWPAQVPVDIYRVQSPALVPDRDERINTQLLTAPYVISLLDDITHISGSNIIVDPHDRKVNDLDRRHEIMDLAPDYPDRVPFVTVTPVRKNGKCGVTLSTKYPDNPYYRGSDGTAALEILVDEGSESQRFAFDIRYCIHKVERAIGTHTETRTVFEPGTHDYNEFNVTVTDHALVDVACFEFIVKATAGVDISVNDNLIGGILDKLSDAFSDLAEAVWDPDDNNPDPLHETANYEIWRGGIANISVQGTPLTPGGNGFTEDRQPIDSPANQAIVENLEFIIDMSLGFMPGVGEATDIMELVASFYTGTDKWGRPMTNFDRVLIMGGLALPLVSGKTVRVLKKELPADELFKMVMGLD